jgi:hypothetical protein
VFDYVNLASSSRRAEIPTWSRHSDSNGLSAPLHLPCFENFFNLAKVMIVNYV